MDSSRDIVKKLRENRMLNERKEYENMDIQELVKLAQEGDQLAFSTISSNYQDLIYRMTKKYVPEDTFDSDDIHQIAEIGLWQAVDQWDGKGNFESFAGMVIKRKLIDEYSKLNTEKSKMNIHSDYLDAPTGSDDEGGEMTLGASMPSKGLSPEEEYLGRDGARKITEFMKNNLSDVERQVIMKYIKGYKVSEISEEENMKYKTVENALKRVKDKLAEYLRNVRESRQQRLSEESIFSDEEKQILMSVLSKINDSKSINESYADMDESQILDTLSEIEGKIEELMDTMRETDDYEVFADSLEEIQSLEQELYNIQDLESIDTEAYEECEKLLKLARRANMITADNVKSVDPYEEVGMRRSDF